MRNWTLLCFIVIGMCFTSLGDDKTPKANDNPNKMPQAPVEKLSYEGSSTIGQNLLPEIAKAFEAKTKIKFESIGIAGSSQGFKAVMEGKVSVAGMSRLLKKEEQAQKPYSEVIGYDVMAVFVNEKNPLKNLSKEQVKGIFTGKITNWKEVGGNNVPISVITEVKGGGRATIEEFKKDVMGGAEYVKSKEIDKPLDCVQEIAKDENAITHASFAFKVKGVKSISLDGNAPTSDKYTLRRPLLLIAKESPKGGLKKFFDFALSTEGQKIVGKYFVPAK